MSQVLVAFVLRVQHSLFLFLRLLFCAIEQMCRYQIVEAVDSLLQEFGLHIPLPHDLFPVHQKMLAVQFTCGNSHEIFLWVILSSARILPSLLQVQSENPQTLCQTISISSSVFFTMNSAPTWKRKAFTVTPEIGSTPFLHSYSTADSNPAVYYASKLSTKDHSD